LRARIERAINGSRSSTLVNRPKNVFLRRMYTIDRVLHLAYLKDVFEVIDCQNTRSVRDRPVVLRQLHLSYASRRRQAEGVLD